MQKGKDRKLLTKILGNSTLVIYPARKGIKGVAANHINTSTSGTSLKYKDHNVTLQV